MGVEEPSQRSTDTSHLPPHGGASGTIDVNLKTKLNVVSFNSCGFKGSNDTTLNIEWDI